MTELKSLSEKVTALVQSQDGSWQSKQKLLDAIEDLRITAMGPAAYITRLRYQPLQNMCLMMAIEMKLLDPIVSRGRETITAETIAAETGSDKRLTARIMRMLTALDICQEVGFETYRSNANAEYLNHPSRKGAVKFINGPTMRAMANVIPYMRANGGVYPQFPDTSKGQKSAAEFTYGMPLWELFRKEPEVLSDFVSYLSGRREDLIGYWFDIYPAREKIEEMLRSTNLSSLQKRALVVDVGGNVGYDLQAFQGRFPHFKDKGTLILQDLPENIQKAKISLGGSGIDAMEYDFFTPQPVTDALIYTFCGICHDWPDPEVKRLLSNTVAVMSSDSILLIDELPLPDEKAPLDLVAYDVLMMLNVCGIERTIGHYRTLLDEVGLELVNVWRSPLDSVLETRLKR